MRCPLCHSPYTQVLLKDYAHCPVCDLRFLDPKLHLSSPAEFERYRLHENDIHDDGYRAFLRPAVEAVKQKPGASGLDFGCGSDSLAAKMLEEKGFRMRLFDPFFMPDADALATSYDFVVATEVAEHFYDPAKEFRLLRSLIRPGGQLVIMTAIYRDTTDFDSWYYRRDPTHVVFYSSDTFRWIAENTDFRGVADDGTKLAVFDA